MNEITMPPACIPSRVLSLLHDFAFKYVTDVLTDAEAFAEHVLKPAGVVEMDDVMHAIQVSKQPWI